MLGDITENEEVITQIVNGALKTEDLMQQYPHVIEEEARLFIQKMKRDIRVDCDFQWDTNEECFKSTLKNIRKIKQ